MTPLQLALPPSQLPRPYSCSPLLRLSSVTSTGRWWSAVGTAPPPSLSFSSIQPSLHLHTHLSEGCSFIRAAWTRRSRNEAAKKPNRKSWKQRTDMYMRPFLLNVFFSKRFIHAKVMHRGTSKVISVATTNAKDLRNSLPSLTDHNACRVVGRLIAERSKEADVYALAYEPKNNERIEGNDSALELLQKLEKSLYDVGPVLDDAELKQFSDKKVKKWLVDLQDALYKADDLLDELSTKAATATQRDPGNSSPWSHYVDSCIEDSGINVIEKTVATLESAKMDISSWRIPSTSLVKSFDIFGRDQDKERIIKSLLDGTCDAESPVIVIPIVGMGVIGKTTLAQLVYNDAKVMEKFGTRAWVCVAENPDPVNVTRTIIGAIDSFSCNVDHFDSLQTDLKEKLTGKRFLVVLDDYATLEPIGRKIVEKCKGLPLAIKTLGGLLRNKYIEGDWKNIFKSEIWELSEDDSKIVPALRVSYHYLPSHLKRCFVYCSIFPEYYEFDKDELILFWMAEDLLQPKENNTLENVGCAYFDELVARSFFQPSNTNEKLFVMHDLMHDLATFFAGKFYFKVKEFGNQHMIDSKTRHLSYAATEDEDSIKLFQEANNRAVHMRTFLYFSFVHLRKSIDIESDPCLLRQQLGCLRVLSFEQLLLASLLDSIGELIHLRYLNLSHLL
ncbi:putative disease resistance RPP13-like protein 1 [Arachis stenosperma]|uniref:putative disease resistance RPP13-like protein 1 n=1 Tax=Arachis stenosperma TaxID=217475 RepID=UPI0025ABB670|nr:putative disease resistance RPP13-like protein 1 [Arachis stenosperma]